MSKEDHIVACRWVTIAIIIHNLVIDVEGGFAGRCWMHEHTHADEFEDQGPTHHAIDEGNESK